MLAKNIQSNKYFMISSALKYFICVLLGLISLYGCMNKYESNMRGYYKIYKFEKLDSSKKVDLPSLALNEDKSFVLTFTNKKDYW
jgi:hypothetical protein